MKQYDLQQFGTSWVLLHQPSQHKANFKSFEALTHHINSFQLLHEISGLEALPPFHREQIGYVPELVHIQEVLLGSGLTNPALLS